MYVCIASICTYFLNKNIPNELYEEYNAIVSYSRKGLLFLK